MDEDKQLTRTQEEAVQYMLRPECDGAALLGFDMGLGKTRTALMLARERDDQVVLVVAPLQTLDGWISTSAVELPDMPVYIIDSSKKGKNALANFQWRARGVYLIGHEYWERLAWTHELYKTRRKKLDPETGKLVPEIKKRKVDSGLWSCPERSRPGYLLVFDESHRSANPDSWTHRALRNIRADFKLAMSGTFFGNGFDGAYGATKWLWPHRTDLLPENIYDWRAKWAQVKYDRFAPRNQKVVGEKEEGAFVASLPCYIRVESSMPEPEHHKLWVDLYPEQRRVYDELERRMVAWIENEPLVVEITMTKRARQRQATLAMPSLTYGETGELEEVSFAEDAESVKIDRLQELLSKELAGEKVLVLTDSQKFARILTARLNRHFGDGAAAEWSGRVTRRNRAQVKDAFINGDLRIIVGVPAAMGVGTDGLQHASCNLVFMSREDRRINNDQAIARLNRKGQKRPVRVWSILARNTVDTGQLSQQVEAALKANRSMRKKMMEERNAHTG